MRYQKPAELTPSEITDLLRRPDISPSERVDTVLSAVYFSEAVSFAGDTLIHEFSASEFEAKIWLKNLFETFYQMRQTTYRIDDSARLLTQFMIDNPESADEVGEILGSLNEFKSMFGVDQ